MSNKTLPVVLPINRTIKETARHVTLFFKGVLNFKPGQFVMMWLPGVDEKPFTLSYHTENEFGITVEEKGKFTKAVSLLKTGEKLGFRGPFGNGFSLDSEIKNICVIAGGCGMAPLAPFIDLCLKHNKKIKIIQGAKTKEDLLFRKRFPEIDYCTDDGTLGYHGLVTEYFDQQKIQFDQVYTCGPEPMMKKVLDICNKKQIDCQVSLERFMKCGIGICASCVCGSERVCVEGPVFTSEKIKKMNDFG